MRPNNFRSGLRRPLSRLAHIMALASLTAVGVSAQVIGFGVDAGINDVVELTLGNDGELSEGRRWPIGPSLTPFAFEIDGDHTAYIVVALPISTSQLLIVDLEANETRRESLLPVGGLELALDQNGDLWILQGRELRLYRPDSRGMELQSTLPDGTDPAGIAWWQDRLYVLLRGAAVDENPSLAEVDPATGALSTHHVLPALVDGTSFLREIDAIDFDDAGGLWLGMTETIATIHPPFTQGMVAHYRNPWTDAAPTSMARWSDAGAQTVMPFAVLGPVGVPDVPVLDHLGSVLLALLLATAAIRLRR